MNVKTFTDELLSGLAGIERFERVVLQAEGPTVSGYAYLDDEFFLRFYFNETTGTTAFALIQNQQRIWGVDYDNRRQRQARGRRAEQSLKSVSNKFAN